MCRHTHHGFGYLPDHGLDSGLEALKTYLSYGSELVRRTPSTGYSGNLSKQGEQEMMGSG